MSALNKNRILSTDKELENITNKSIEYVKEFINTANSRCCKKMY